MRPIISKISEIPAKESIVILINKSTKLNQFNFSTNEISYITEQIEDDKKSISLNQFKHWTFIYVVDEEIEIFKLKEDCRIAGDKLLGIINENKISKITIIDSINMPETSLAFAEGMALGNYQFLKYKKNGDDKISKLKTIQILSKKISDNTLNLLNALIEGVYKARTLINEPHSFLTAIQFAKEIKEMSDESGFKVEILNETKIESLKMGGLLAVNKGSTNPPTFSILEWKPEDAKNSRPYVLVGKGLVMDTGGLNIKTGTNMDTMKSDMSGGAVVAGVFYAVAKAKLPIHLIGLIPSTDNMPGPDSYVTGDVIKMYDGTTVEVLNTDAEGRMILADALSYAKKYKPELVIDIATLTGAAAAAIGKYGIVAMGNASNSKKELLKECGNEVYERIVEFPMWDEYKELLKSDIADLKNIGGPRAGAITAGKFLEHFTNYDWMHFDIAGVAFAEKKDSYRGLGGTGVPIRLIFEYLKKI